MRLVVALVLGLGGAGLWLWLTGPGTTLPFAVIAWVIAGGGFIIGWRLMRPRNLPPEPPEVHTASTDPYGIHGRPKD